MIACICACRSGPRPSTALSTVARPPSMASTRSSTGPGIPGGRAEAGRRRRQGSEHLPSLGVSHSSPRWPSSAAVQVVLCGCGARPNFPSFAEFLMARDFPANGATSCEGNAHTPCARSSVAPKRCYRATSIAGLHGGTRQASRFLLYRDHAFAWDGGPTKEQQFINIQE